MIGCAGKASLHSDWVSRIHPVFLAGMGGGGFQGTAVLKSAPVPQVEGNSGEGQ